MTVGGLVRDRWPVLAGQVEAALVAAGESTLVHRWREIRVIAVCGCGDSFCRSFWTGPRPDGGFGPGHRTIVLDSPWPGFLILDVVGEEIAYVEVLYRAALD